MAIYNVDKISDWYDDFTNLKNKFNNTYYSDYKTCYIRTCTDDAVQKMKNKLNVHYSKIQKIYNNINNFWKEYLTDLKNTDSRLAGGKGSINANSVSSKISKLPTLKEYKRSLGVRIKSVSGVIGTAKGLEWSEDRTMSENLKNSLNVLQSTAAVTATSVISGVYGLVEDLVDGVLWLGTAAVTGVATLFGEEEWANNAQNTMMDVINYDVVGEVNKAFYEGTTLGRSINEKSMIKYDSEVAQIIQDASTKVAEFAAATALTIATGGMAAPIAALIVGGTGFLIGAGDKAQEDFEQEDRNFWSDSAEITIAGGIKAIEFYSEGQMGSSAINAVNTVKSAGGVKCLFNGMKTVFSNGEIGLFTKETLKSGIKATFKDVDTYMDSIGAAFNNITYDNENGLQVNWKELAKETACNFTMNCVFGFIGKGFENKMTSGMENVNISLSDKNILSDSDLDSLRKEYDDLLKKSKEDWFINAKEVGDNGWAGNLNDVKEVNDIVKRMGELEAALGIENTGVPKSNIYDYSQAKKNIKKVSQTADNVLRVDSDSIKNVDTHKKIWFDSANGKTMIEITDDLDPNIIFKHAAYPENVTIKKGNLEFYSDGYKINARVASKNMDDLSLNKTYFDNSDFFQKRGISYEQYAANNGIQLTNYSNELDLATDLGDENWYLVNVLKNNMQNMTPQQYSMVCFAIEKPRCDLDSQELRKLASTYLDSNDIINLNGISKNPNMQNLTIQERHTLFQFQRAGGCEINGMLRGKDYSIYGLNSFYDIETNMQNINGGYGKAGIDNFKHPRDIDKKYTIVEQIDDIIKNNSNINTIKGVSYLNSVGANVPTKEAMDIIDQYGPSSPQALQAVQNLIGLDITDKAFNSKTIPPNRVTNYSQRFNKLKRGEKGCLDLKVESYISPGCGAYIDTCGSFPTGLGELLVKRNCTQKIIDAYIDPNTSKLVLVTLYT